MKNLIRKKLREQIIDGQKMNKAVETICNKMTINSYEEALHYVKQAMKQYDQETQRKLMQKLITPLENLKHEEIEIYDEVKKYHMSGDSLPDEADTYWHQIQTVLCELGNNFQ